MSTIQAPRYEDMAAFHAGDRLVKARKLRGFKNTKELAMATRIDRGALGRYEDTGEIPYPSTKTLLLQTLHLREEWLDTGEGPMWTDGGPNPGGHEVDTSLYDNVTYVTFASPALTPELAMVA